MASYSGVSAATVATLGDIIPASFPMASKFSLAVNVAPFGGVAVTRTATLGTVFPMSCPIAPLFGLPKLVLVAALQRVELRRLASVSLFVYWLPLVHLRKNSVLLRYRGDISASALGVAFQTSCPMAFRVSPDRHSFF
jgi:hypothetical protein